MAYSTDSNKWKAYQFLDPFAAGSFYVCNKVSKYFCRPDCDAHPITELRLEIKFLKTVNDAVEMGYVPCDSCDPMRSPVVDVSLLISTVREINALIGFVPPLMDDDEHNTDVITENLSVQRRQLVPVVGYNGKYNRYEQTASVSKNDLEHYRLVDLACRHLALAAAMSIFHPSSTSANSPRSDDEATGKRKRKRRGGVLGFKELAAKSKLSAWHFHRVFKSVTGLTPKTYGDKCWEYFQEKHDKREGSYTPNIKPYSTPGSSLQLPVSPRKRVRVEEDELPASKRPAVRTYDAPSYELPYEDPSTASISPILAPSYGFQDRQFSPSFEFGTSRATSAPDLASFGVRPTLFGHKPLDYTNEVSQLGPELTLMHQQYPEQYTECNPQDIFSDVSNMFAGATSSFSSSIFPSAGDEFLAMPDMADMQDAFSLGLLPELMTNVGL